MNEEDNIPEPFFHETENFSSAYFGKVPETISKSNEGKIDRKLIASLVAQLTDPNLKETRQDVYRTLREGNAQQLLVGILTLREHEKHRTALIAACWECGIDFSEHLETFCRLAVEGDYLSCLECMTVITENMEGPFDAEQVERSLALIKKSMTDSSEKTPLFEMILTRIA